MIPAGSPRPTTTQGALPGPPTPTRSLRRGDVGRGVKRYRPGPMRVAFRISLLAIGLAASFAATGAAVAGALFEFPNLPGREPAHLIGYLARPDAGLSALVSSQRGDNVPYPAVVVLHGCSGISSHSAAIADRLGAWGYVALTVDTL